MKNPSFWGMFPFLWLAMKFGSPFAAIVFFNGIMCHGTRIPSIIKMDVFCNWIFTIFAILTLGDIGIVKNFIWIPFIFMASYIINNNAIHALGVQLPAAYLMYRWLKEREPHPEPLEPSPLSDQQLI